MTTGPERLDELRAHAEKARAAGAGEEARRACREILRRAPEDPAALNLLAEVAADEGRAEEGFQWALRALRASPGSARPHYTQGRLLQAEGRMAEAEASYRRALVHEPAGARIHNNLGCVLQMQGKLDEALACYRRALALDPALPQASQNYAAITRDPAAMSGAVQSYLRHIAEQPRDAEAFNNLGNLYREMGRHHEALEAFERAVSLRPDFAEARFSRSFVLLLLGDYRRGFDDYEWRWRVKGLNAPARTLGRPLWQGESLPRGTVLLHAEQGFGDTLQFVRYAPLVARRCAGVVLECQPELKRLLATTPGLQSVVTAGEPAPAFDAHIPLMSLPRVFGTTIDEVFWPGPYVRPDAADCTRWRALVEGERARLRVGLVWAGRPEQWDDRKRSVSLAMLAPLAQAQASVFYSLQKGPAAAESASPAPGMRFVDLTGRIADFSDTAALLSQLDVLVTVDTSVAHLGAAMGVPTWVLVAFAPDWRYHLERDDNPWYPTMRLYRQERDGDWSAPIARVARDLAAKAR